MRFIVREPFTCGVRGGVWKEEEANDAHEDGGEAYDDEDPTPAFIVAYAIHFCDSSGEEARKSTAGGGSTVEKTHWKLRSVRWVPLADEVDCTWEEASSETALSVRNMHAKVEGS